ncbi:MAG: hypothetical protein ACLFWH_14175 [Actinomycetota bacterium]
MASVAPPEYVDGGFQAPDVLSCALRGALTVVAFTVVHSIWIADIWFNVVPMVASGAVVQALCGVTGKLCRLTPGANGSNTTAQ